MGGGTSNTTQSVIANNTVTRVDIDLSKHELTNLVIGRWQLLVI